MQATTSKPCGRSKKEQRIANRRLFSCVEDGDLNKIQHCLNDGANINARDGEGLTVLHIAVDNKNLEIVKFLLENGATSDVKNNDNETPLSIAQRLNEPGIIQLLNPQLSIPKPIEPKFETVGEADQHQKKTGSAVHGHIYQLKLLMLFLHRGVSNQYSFRLGTEIKEAQKFDDLVFEYTECGGKKYRLLQAKHRLNKTKKITSADLLTTNNEDYSLIKYYVSYVQAKKDSFFKDGTIKDVIISTNISLDLRDLKQSGIEVQEMASSDNILDMRGRSKRYRLSEKLVPKLKQKIVQKKQESIQRKKVGISSTWRFGTKENLNWSNIVITDEEVADFLNHLVFAVNQPSEEELGEIIKDEIGQKLDLDSITTENTFNKLFVKMLNWLQGKESGRFLSCEEGEDFFQEAKRGMPILFSIKVPISSFTGRVEPLNNVHKALMKHDKSVVISGLGGIGKSELAKKYVSLHSQDYDNKVLWINAESFSTLSESFHRLAVDKLGISSKNIEGKEKDIKSLVEDVYRFFCKGRSLFVFDNAEKLKDGISEFLPYLPENMSKPHILITSRNQKWPSNMLVLPLDIFSEAEAIEVIKKSLHLENDAQTEDVEDLSKELQYFPLALQQAVAYIRSFQHEASNLGSEFKFSDYLEKYKKKTGELLNYSFPEESDDSYTKTTLMTWEVTLDRIREKENGDVAVKVMNILAYCEPENIPIEILFLDLENNKEKIGSAIELLKQYSMLNLEKRTINIHRLVQQVTRMKLKEQRKEEKDTFVAALTMCSFVKSSCIDNVKAKCLNHIISIWHYSSKFVYLVDRFQHIPTYICEELLKSARFEEAYLFGMKVFELFLSLPSYNSFIKLNIIFVNFMIAEALSQQGKYDRALKMNQLGYELSKTMLGPDEPIALKAKSFIAQTLSKQGKYKEALHIYEEVLVVSKKMLGESHSDTISIKYQIAKTLLDQGEYDQASQIFQDIYSIQESISGKHHPTTLKTKNCIANLHISKGNYGEALQIFEEVCGIQESTLGKNHTDVFTTKKNIGEVLSLQGKYSQVLQMNQDMLSIEKEQLGNSHPHVMSTYTRVVQRLRQLGKYDEALEMCEEILQKQKDILGSDHPDAFTTLFFKACILDEKGKCCDALQVLDEVLRKRSALLGSNHPDTLTVKNHIAIIYNREGKYNEACQYYEDIYTIQRSSLGENHPHTLITKNNIGMALSNKNEFDKALNILQSVFSTQQTLFPNRLDSLGTKNNIASVFGRQQKHNEALKIFREVLDSQEAILGREYNKTTIRTKKNIAGELLAMGKHNEALRVFQDVLNGLNCILGPEHDETQEVQEAVESFSERANNLLTAVRTNNRIRLEDLVKKGEDVNTKDNENTTLLHYAANNGNADIANILMKHDADITQVTNKGNTPLHTAISQCHREVVEALLQHARELTPTKFNDFINAKTTIKGTTALHIAAQKDNLKLVELLLQSGAIYNIKNKKNRTPFEVTLSDEIKALFNSIDELFEHVKRGERIKVKQLLKKGKGIINARDADGCTALFCATQNGLMSTAQLLLDEGADPILVTNKGNTPLHMASCKGNNTVVKALLSRVKTDAPKNLDNFINAQTTVGKTTALHVASNLEVVKSLLECGAIYNIKNKEDKIPFDTAKDSDIKNLLVRIDELFTAAKNGDSKIINNLVSLREMNLFEAAKNVRNDQGHTLLRVAITNKHENIARELSKMLKTPGRK